MRLVSLTLASVASLAILTVANTADAAPRRRGGSGIHQGGFIYGSPGFLALPVEDDEIADLDPSWQWSFGGGYLFTPGRAFKASIGGAAEHMLLNFDCCGFEGSQLRALFESRIGGGTNRVWGYGLVGMGFGLNFYDEDLNGPSDDLEVDPAFAFQLGGGVQGIVWRNLFLGGELDFDFTVGFDDDRFGDDEYEVHTFGIKFIIGWYF